MQRTKYERPHSTACRFISWVPLYSLLWKSLLPASRKTRFSTALTLFYLPKVRAILPFLWGLFFCLFFWHFADVQSLSHVQLFETPWTTACQASLSITNSRSLLQLMSIESVMPSNHLILCRPHFLPPSILPSIRVFSNESSYQVANVLELQLQHQSFQRIFRIDFL